MYTMGITRRCSLLILFVSAVAFWATVPAWAATRYFHFNLEWKKVTRLCHTKPVLTINGQYPGPTIAVREGDAVVVKVTNSVERNTSIHWHGIRQFRTCWADGPAYITQCPIQSGRAYTYRFKADGQRGTLLWHAHLAWQRATVHGAFIIYPKLKLMPYPFLSHVTAVQAEIPLIFGEWWNSDVELVEKEIVMYGGGPNVSDAYTINGLPGPLYPCSAKDTFIQEVESGKTYMLRLINANLNGELFFAVSNHTLTVVEADAAYVKPFTTPAIMVAPGQTTTVLLTADVQASSGSVFTMAVRPYVTAIVPFDGTTAVGFLRYKVQTINTASSAAFPTRISDVALPANLPPLRDTTFAESYASRHHSLATAQYPCKVPQTVDISSLLLISLNLQDCCEGCTCKGSDGKRFLASINNQSFIRPQISLLQSYYADPRNYTGLASSDFPTQPPQKFNYTADPAPDVNLNAGYGSKIMVVPYGKNVEFVLQDTAFINVENHPIHIHGHNFFVVGSGVGNFDKEKDPMGYNLVDPPERNTVAVPSGGWAAIRFKADNPGIWFVHCHLEVHTTWGLAMAFVVENGNGPGQSIIPPPNDLPPC